MGTFLSEDTYMLKIFVKIRSVFHIISHIVEKCPISQFEEFLLKNS